MSQILVRAHGSSHAGKVRDGNEDALIVDDKWGLYAVLDGMGGAMAGDVASNRARDVIHEYVRARKNVMEPRALLEAAIGAASAAVHGEAQARRDRKGMGTTVVACVIVGAKDGSPDKTAVIAHVGDSRAYLLRDGRLNQITRDHTVVAELLAQGAISPQDAESHFYKNVLSRNLGAKPEVRVDICEIELVPGDRLLLCSDGLHGFASHDALQYLVGSSEPPEQVSRDLIEAALRGGGGDNITAVVIEAGVAVVPRSTQIVRTSGAVAWWSRRSMFLEAALRLGLPRSPICAVLTQEEAIEIIAGNLCEALFHDLEKSTGVNVWTYAENLAHGWLDQGGGYPPLAELLDILAGAAQAVIADLRGHDPDLSILVDAGITRALMVADMAIGGVLAERLRAVEAELLKIHAARQLRQSDETRGFVDSPTIPWMRSSRPPTMEPASPEVLACLDAAADAASARVSAERTAVRDVIAVAHRAAASADPRAADDAARDLWGVRSVEEQAIAPLFDAIDQARILHVEALHDQEVPAVVLAAAMRRITTAHVELSAALAHLVLDAAAPGGTRLQELAGETTALRAQVAANEARLAESERKQATLADATRGALGEER